MSESMAFIGGVAVAGLAALLLLKGANNSLQPNLAMTPQIPSALMQQPQMVQPVQYPPNYGQPIYPNQPSPTINADNHQEIEKLSVQMERLKADNEQLRFQNQQLQGQVQNFTQQQWQLTQQANQKILASATVPSYQQPPQQNPWWSSPIVWAVGGMSLTIGGGVIAAGVLSLFSPRQRSARTVQVIHPYTGSTPPLVPVRRAEFLPTSSHTEARRVEATEYDEHLIR
jgi:hypothetical protein